MEIKIAIIDDEKADYKHLYNELKAWEAITHHKLIIKHYETGAQVINDYESHIFNFDLLFLDIIMPNINGIDLIRQLQKTNLHILFILTSSNRNYADAGYSIYAFDFLPKPVQSLRLASAMNRVTEKIGFLQTKTIVVNSEGQTFKISYADVLYFESDKNYILIHAIKGDPIKVRGTIKSFLAKCPDFFIKINRNCIVNMTYVGSITRESLKLSRCSTVLTLSKSAYPEVISAFERLN